MIHVARRGICKFELLEQNLSEQIVVLKIASDLMALALLKLALLT